MYEKADPLGGYLMASDSGLNRFLSVSGASPVHLVLEL
jgi:hypothetical protein